MEDWEAWQLYPHHQWVFNKLLLSQRLGYVCGPTPMPVSQAGEYCVRPIYNLGGMSAGARILWLEPGHVLELPPSHFWCERFVGTQYSVNYVWQQDHFEPQHTSIGENSPEAVYRFERWTVTDHQHHVLPEWINDFADVCNINIEFIEDRIVEIHLRHGEDFPDGATELLCVYEDSDPGWVDHMVSEGWQFAADRVDAEKNIPVARLGMLWR